MSNRIPRKTAIPLSELMKEFVRDSRLSSGLNTRRIFSAWDDASGAGKYTVGRFFRDGRLFITVSSSVVRSQLYFQKDAIVEKINEILRKDELFAGDDKYVGYVKELILK